MKGDPERTCVGCRKKQAKKNMLRIVREHESDLVRVDPGGKDRGRGAYICYNKECARKALGQTGRKNRLGNALHVVLPSSVIEGLLKDVEELIEMRSDIRG
ncbi:MAG: YlxR family protein [bacterium]